MTNEPRDLPLSGTHDHNYDDPQEHINFLEAVVLAHGLPVRCLWCDDAVINRTITMGGAHYGVETIHADECPTNDHPEMCKPEVWGLGQDGGS